MCEVMIEPGSKHLLNLFLGGTAIPAWAIVVLTGFGMLLLGGGLYALLQKFVVDSADTGETHTYQPALQIES